MAAPSVPRKTPSLYTVCKLCACCSDDNPRTSSAKKRSVKERHVHCSNIKKKEAAVSVIGYCWGDQISSALRLLGIAALLCACRRLLELTLPTTRSAGSGNKLFLGRSVFFLQPGTQIKAPGEKVIMPFQSPEKKPKGAFAGYTS